MPRSKPRAAFSNLCLAIVGPGGTGKTAVLKISEALTIFFAGSDTVKKLAPSNAAARILGGDTIHALCKLPFGNKALSSKKGRLTKHTLAAHRRKWTNTIAAYLDEVSMIAADQFLQCDVRLRQGKMSPQQPFGGLAMNICGDFLQLPPVDKDGSRRSLAMPLVESASAVPDVDVPHEDIKAEDVTAAGNAETRQGLELWRSIRSVVCLNINLRAPDALGRLQDEMRCGTISDAMWDFFMSRVIQPNDARLKEKPFVDHNLQFIVHRHRIRVMRSYDHAKDESRRLAEPLYVVQARDEVVHSEDLEKFSESLKTELLRRVNPEQTKGLPSFLPLHRGLRLLLSSKDCVRLGIMKGCPVVLREIVFADDEVLPYHQVAGHAHSLQYMPVSLLLQAEDVAWTLPAEDLPQDLPQGVDRRGLFQLKPSCDYLRGVRVDDAYISVRRTSFLVTPADTVTVYAAQGGTYDAVIVDMQRPPNLDLAKHWLACYVMLSRARSFGGFLVLRPATRKELSTRPPKYLLEELERLLKLEKTSHKDLVDYIESLSMVVPAVIHDLLDVAAATKQVQQVNEVRGRELPHVASMHEQVIVEPRGEPRGPQRKRLRKKTTIVDEVGPESVSVGADVSMGIPKGVSTSKGHQQASGDCSERDILNEDVLADGGVAVHLALGLGLTIAAAAASKVAGKASDVRETGAEENTRHGFGGDEPAKRVKTDGGSSVASTGEVQLPHSGEISGSPLESFCIPCSAGVPSCSSESHFCGPPDAERGCTSCGFTCHSDCCSVLCTFRPCPYCTSRCLVTHENSTLCMEAQMYNNGCHGCGRLDCWTAAAKCHANCTRDLHVCDPSPPGGGCSSCGKSCHKTNKDQRCPFFERGREVAWTADAQQLMDTLPGTQGTVPHMSQLPWHFLNEAKIHLVVDGTAYRRGYGNPGDSTLGEVNNCLIDSLRQCLDDLSCDCRDVRRDLQKEFGGSEGQDHRRVVTHSSYLDVEFHWQAVLRGLLRHNSSGRDGSFEPNDYCIVALYGDRPGNGVVLGNMNAAQRLVIVNWGDVHFDPCLRL